MGVKDIAFPHLGIYLENLPKSFSVFGFEIAFYGVIIGIGVILGVLMAERMAKAEGMDTDIIWDFGIYAVIFSVIGARIYYVIFSWDQYKNDLLSIFNLRRGGLAIYGAVIAAFAVTVPLSGKASAACLLMAGSTNHMQSRIDNGIVVVRYKDGTSDTLRLVNPDNWCPIEQDYFEDGKAFCLASSRPYRVCLGNGKVSRDLGRELGITGVYGRPIPGGAAQMLNMPLNPEKKLESITVRTLSCDVVIGLMGVTLKK